MTANNCQEAMDYFLSHSSGSVTCEKQGKQKEVSCYSDAVDFFSK